MNPGKTLLIAALALAFTSSRAHAADESLTEAKALFAAASFDGALAALEHLDAEVAAQPETLEYKALCLLALGRAAEAQKVTEALVTATPTFMPADRDLSPRFLELLAETRRKIVPAVARRLFADARDEFRAKQTSTAQRLFQQVVTLATDPVWRESAEAEDLRTLASGFLDLLDSTKAGDAAVQPKATAAAAAVAATPAPAVSPVALGDMQAPVAISQPMPQWKPGATTVGTYHGAIKVLIGADGRVTQASMSKASHPVYDQLLIDAARNWLYKPALRNGQPVPAEKIVDFYLRSK